MQTLVNGQPAATVATADRGLQYGDGVFETIAVVAGRPLLWQAHVHRLLAGAGSLGLPLPDTALLAAEADGLCQGTRSAVLKILLTAGSGGRGYARPGEVSCNRILSLHPLPDYPAHYWHAGVPVTLCQTRLALQPRLAGIKHCNRLEQVLARREWRQTGFAEGLVSDMQGRLAEATMSNVFAVRDGVLCTPGLLECGVHGVMRETVLGLARAAGCQVALMEAPLPEWLEAQELFLTNSLIGIWPIRQVLDTCYEPGAVTRELQQRLFTGGLAPLPATDRG